MDVNDRIKFIRSLDYLHHSVEEEDDDANSVNGHKYAHPARSGR